LLEDLATTYEQLRRGESVKLPAKTTSFKSWAEALQEYARSEAAQGELSYWLSPERRAISRLPVDFPDAEEFNTEESAHTVQSALSAEETRALLQEVPQAYHTQINDVLLTALAQVLTRWTGHQTVLVDLEGHGRDTEIEGIDVTRTVGWFTTIYPVLLELAESGNAGESLKRIKELLRALPGRSISYGLMRFMHPDDRVREQMRALPQAEVSFLYLGQTDQSLPESTPFAAALESSGPMASPGAHRSHLITISGLITGGQLQLGWTYSDQMHRRSTIEQLSQSYLNALRELIEHCLSAGSGGYTPSDFPDAELNQSELDELMAELSQQGK
jgi:non-ribosomal peptide synthase protein (TIGR01720 family)